MAKKSTPVKPTGPLFTIVDSDRLEVWTNLTEEEVHATIRQVIESEHPIIEDAELLTIINQSTGIPYDIEQRVEYKLVEDKSQPQFREKRVEQLLA